MRTLTKLAVVAGAVTLAVVIGQRMSSDAMAVLIGVVFGVAASIPTSLLVVAATRGRRSEQRRIEQTPDPRPQQIIVHWPTGLPAPGPYPFPPHPGYGGFPDAVTGGGSYELLEGDSFE